MSTLRSLDVGNGWATLALAVLFATVAVLSGVDLALDVAHGVELRHALAEGGVMLTGLAGASWMIRRLVLLAAEARDLSRRAETLEADLEQSNAALAASRLAGDKWRREVADLVRGLSGAIDRQLAEWELTAAEQEVALLLLKGLSHKEIADLRGTSEATVRQQSRGIYRKAGLEGRHDLAAFFLEDLLAPRGESNVLTGPASGTSEYSPDHRTDRPV